MAARISLSRFPFIQTVDVDQAREALARVYWDGSLTPVDRAKSFSQRFNVVPLGGVTLTAMEWGTGVAFRTPASDGCFDFCSLSCGAAEVYLGSQTVEMHSRHAVVLSPLRSLVIRWNDRILSLSAKVNRELMESHLAAIAGIEIGERLEFSAAMPFTGDNRAVWRLIRLMADEIDREDSLLAYPLVGERFSETLLTAILYAQPHNYSEALIRPGESAEPCYVRRAEEYMEAHCNEPVTTQLLATVVGVSLRTLYTGFRKHRGYTPREFLRMARLRRVRDALLAAPPGSLVSQFALKWGFNHLGRFSVLYRRHFGESPSETLRR